MCDTRILILICASIILTRNIQEYSTNHLFKCHLKYQSTSVERQQKKLPKYRVNLYYICQFFLHACVGLRRLNSFFVCRKLPQLLFSILSDVRKLLFPI